MARGGSDGKIFIKRLLGGTSEESFFDWYEGLDEDGKSWVVNCIEDVVDFYDEHGATGKHPAITKNVEGKLREINKKRDKKKKQLRVYYTREGKTVIFLLGGDKDSQDRDIKFAKKLVKARRRS